MLTIVIQAGGQSLRMGQDKALLPFLGQPLITRLIERLSPAADELLITTNQPENYKFLGLPLFPDKIPNRGALGGLYTALSAASHPLVAVVACDMPFASLQLFQLGQKIITTESVDVVIPQVADMFEPLHAIYRKEICLPAIEQALNSGKWKIISWFPEVKVRVFTSTELEQQDRHHLAFINVNTPQDLAQAEALALSQAASDSI